MRTLSFVVTALAIVLWLSPCASTKESLYPQRPAVTPGPPIADPPTSKLVAHVAILDEGLRALLDTVIPLHAEGTFKLVGERSYRWSRQPLRIAYDNSKQSLTLTTEVAAEADLPAMTMRFPLKLVVEVQPALTPRYHLLLQAAKAGLTSDDRRLRAAEWSGGLLTGIQQAIEEKLKSLDVDLAPLLQEPWQRLAKPLMFDLGRAQGCLALDVTAVEASPTQFSGGLEKDLALTLKPAVTLPCAAPAALLVERRDKETAAASTTASHTATAASAPLSHLPASTTTAHGPMHVGPPLPPLHNVASLPTGAFTLTIPVAASYDELALALEHAFTGGKLFFSADNPELYISEPQIYAAGGEVVVRVKLGGQVQKGMRVEVDGEIFLAGHPVVQDNFLEFPDLTPTVESQSALVKVAVAVKQDDLAKAVRQALRLDLARRLQDVRGRLESALTVRKPLAGGATELCVTPHIDRIAVAGFFAHDSYLRGLVEVTAQVSAYVPCPSASAAAAAP